MPSELAFELTYHARKVPTPPASTIQRGPMRSTIQPSKGTSQVSSRMKIVNATWISALVHPNFCWIGSTNNVQPYWRLATLAMQMMPRINWIQRLESLKRAATADMALSLGRKADFAAERHEPFRPFGRRMR